MNEQNPQENRSNIPKQAYYSELDNQEYEINLSALLSGLYTQWRWLAGITFTGTLIAVLIALSSPRAYEVDAHVMQPTKADVAIFNTTGYVNTDNHANWTQQELFNKYYDKLRSQDNFYQFVKTNAWLNKFYPDNASEEEKQLADLYKNLSIETLEPKKRKVS
jgi:LPS O-antigen subunit length determinant protein (WzzB/FepE family)